MESGQQAPAQPLGRTRGFVFDQAARLASGSKARYLLVVLMLEWPTQWAMVVKSMPARRTFRAGLCRLYLWRPRRHTGSLTVLPATQDMRRVSRWFRHAPMQSPEMYTRADPSGKLEALESVMPPERPSGRFEAPDKLLASLRARSLMPKGTTPK